MANTLSEKKIVLGVTGSIAAYKAADLIRRLQERGASVQVVMTKSAGQFITADTLRTLSGMPVLSDMFAEPLHWKVEHVSLADWADLVLIAPATANTMAQMAHGLCSDLLACLALSTRAPIVIAPAMDEGMWLHAATQANAARLKELGYTIIEPDEGGLASGKVGRGRLASIEFIASEVERLLTPQDLADLHIVVTAGPTREAIDAIRFISNRSSGKMGYAIAAAARKRGARVTLVSGPTSLPPPAGVGLIAVESAAQMLEASKKHAAGADAFIGAAAVGDFTPEKAVEGKIKRAEGVSLQLKPTQDAIAAVAGLKNKRPGVVVGFAAESENLLENAKIKLENKGLDLIVANGIGQAAGGFASDFNQASLVYPDGRIQSLVLLSKADLAEEILTAVKSLINR